MKLAMAYIAQYFKVAQIIVERIAINMVDHLATFELSSKMLFHHPSVLERPLAGWSHFDGDILPGRAISLEFSASDDPFCEHREGPGVLHSLHFGRGALFPEVWILTNIEAFFTLFWIMVRTRAINSAARCYRFATNATWFYFGRFHITSIPNSTNL